MHDHSQTLGGSGLQNFLASVTGAHRVSVVNDNDNENCRYRKQTCSLAINVHVRGIVFQKVFMDDPPKSGRENVLSLIACAAAHRQKYIRG